MNLTFSPRRIAAVAFTATLSLLLAACFVTPGKFDAALDLRKSGTFSYSYKGEIFVLGLSDLMDLASASDAAYVPSPCFSDEDPEKERPCTKEEQETGKANWEDQQQASAEKRKKDNESMKVMLGGLDPADPKAAEELAARLRRQAGFKTVVYKGNGLYEVDFALTGHLTHDFAFPTIEKMQQITPFFVLNRRADGSVRLDSPALQAQEGMGGMPFGNVAQMAAAERAKATPEEAKKIPEFPQVDGRFVLTTDGEILANNTDEGATSGPTGKRLEWKITPRDKVGPMALIGLGK